MDLLDFFLLFDDDSEQLEYLELLQLRKRRKVHDLYQNRQTEGAFEILIRKYLFNDDQRFAKYFRVTPQIFFDILSYIHDDLLTTPNNRYKNPISPEQKLCLALRYVKRLFI